MKRKRLGEEQIIGVLKEAEAGAKPAELCRRHGISEATYYNWKAKYAGMTVSEARRLRELAAIKRRYGYRRLHVLLRREGFVVNRKRVQRLYREAGLTVRRRKRKRIGLVERQSLPKPIAPNISWSMDFVADGLDDGRRLRCLTIVDDCTRECLAIKVDTSLTGKRVVAVLDRLLDGRGAPVSITVGHGPEFESQALDAWAYQHDIRLAFIRPDKPVENAYIESFNGKLRDECLHEHWFVTMDHARTAIEKWREDYNVERPHSSLADLTPNEYARRLAEVAEQRVSLAADSTCEPD